MPFSVLCQHPVFQDLMEKSTQYQLVVSLPPGFVTILFLSFPIHFMRSKILVSIDFLIAYSRPALIYTLIFYFSPYSSSLSFRTFMICCCAAWMEKMRKNMMSLTVQHLSKKKQEEKKGYGTYLWCCLHLKIPLSPKETGIFSGCFDIFSVLLHYKPVLQCIFSLLWNKQPP